MLEQDRKTKGQMYDRKKEQCIWNQIATVRDSF